MFKLLINVITKRKFTYFDILEFLNVDKNILVVFLYKNLNKSFTNVK